MENAPISVEEIQCDSVDEFWNALSPVGKLGADSASDYVYRGQRDASWPLVPRAHRRDCLEKYKKGIHASFVDKPGQFFFEWLLLKSFILHCDDSGLRIPNDSIKFRNDFEDALNLHGRDSKGWPLDEDIELMALAQHHGVPTRLLDFTTSAYVAAYFAAADAVEYGENGPSEFLSVTAFNTGELGSYPNIIKVRVPGSTSTNLSAQRGLFMLARGSAMRGDIFHPNVSLESHFEHPNAMLKRVTLPTKAAGQLLIHCHKFGITAASLFPGYDGAAKATLEAMLARSYCPDY